MKRWMVMVALLASTLALPGTLAGPGAWAQDELPASNVNDTMTFLDDVKAIFGTSGEFAMRFNSGTGLWELVDADDNLMFTVTDEGTEATLDVLGALTTSGLLDVGTTLDVGTDLTVDGDGVIVGTLTLGSGAVAASNADGTLNLEALEVGGGSNGEVLTLVGGVWAPSSAATGTVDGSGTGGTLPIWSDSDTLGDSVIKQSSGAVQFGTVPTTVSTVAGTLLLAAFDPTGASSGQVPTYNGSTVAWATPAGGGNVSGPGSSTDHAIARWNSTSGTALLNSAVTLDGSGNMGGVVTQTFNLSQDYTFTEQGTNFAAQSQTSGASAGFALFPKDGDGTDNALFNAYGVGTPGSITNRERLNMGYLTSGNIFTVRVDAAGSGTVRELHLGNSTDTDSLIVRADGSLSLTPVVKLTGQLRNEADANDYLDLVASTPRLNSASELTLVSNNGLSSKINLHVAGTSIGWEINAIGGLAPKTAAGYIQFPNISTTTRDALTPANGMMIYNTTTGTFQGYDSGWVTFTTS